MSDSDSRRFIGIDPGGSGGMACLTSRGHIIDVTALVRMTEPDILAWLISVSRTRLRDPFAVLEHVWSSPGWGHVGAFKFGVSYGTLKTALVAAGIPFDEVIPRKWQLEIGVRYPKNTPRDKNVTKRRAQALFPGLPTITHAVADALLIAEYCRRLKR